MPFSWKEQIEEIKKRWVIFLLFGIIIIIINTAIQTYITYTITEQLKGPPCRVYAQEIFNQSKENEFELPLLILNLRNEKLIIDKVNSYCYWKVQTTEREQPATKPYIPSGPKIPQEPPSIKSYDQLVWRSLCKAPPKEGNYPIRIEVITNKGKCEKNILMVVE
jgi:hypothetical protein